MSGETAPDGGQSRPDWRVPALRCGLEVSLVALITAYLWVNLNSPLFSGVVAVVGLVGSVAVLFYYVNEQAFAWVRYASGQNRRRKRRRQKQRRERQRAKREQEDGREERRQRRRSKQRTTGDGE